MNRQELLKYMSSTELQADEIAVVRRVLTGKKFLNPDLFEAAVVILRTPELESERGWLLDKLNGRQCEQHAKLMSIIRKAAKVQNIRVRAVVETFILCEKAKRDGTLEAVQKRMKEYHRSDGAMLAGR